MVIYNVPFYPNTKDDTHCVQACFKSILKYFLNKNFSFKELDKLTKKAKGKGTWFFPMYLELSKIGFDVREIYEFDYVKYLSEGKNYLYKNFPKVKVEWYLKNSNLLDVKDYIRSALKVIKHENRKASLTDFERLFSDGYLVVSDINYFALQRKPGYASHAVVIYGFDRDNFYLHDPGLPPRKSLKVRKKLFQKAGGDNLSAFKLVSDLP